MGGDAVHHRPLHTCVPISSLRRLRGGRLSPCPSDHPRSAPGCGAPLVRPVGSDRPLPSYSPSSKLRRVGSANARNTKSVSVEELHVTNGHLSINQLCGVCPGRRVALLEASGMVVGVECLRARGLENRGARAARSGLGAEPGHPAATQPHRWRGREPISANTCQQSNGSRAPGHFPRSPRRGLGAPWRIRLSATAIQPLRPPPSHPRPSPRGGNRKGRKPASH